MKPFKSLFAALEPWFEKPLGALPKKLQERVEEEFFPFSWNKLDATQRRIFAQQADAQHDPALEAEQEAGFNLAMRRRELQNDINKWEGVAATTATELSEKEARLKALRAELRRLKTPRLRSKASGKAATGFIAYPKALEYLESRLGASPEEVAAWIFSGPEAGGLRAYRNANELSPPPRFFYDVLIHADGDYLAPLMGCWFDMEELEGFQPADRYITGQALIDRWQPQLGSNARAFVQAKIEESRLLEIHPIFGGTQGTFGNDDAFPMFEQGLFVLSHVEAVEEADLPGPGERTRHSVGTPAWRSENARKAALALHGKPGGSHEKRAAIRELWASGKYTTRERCAEQEAGALGMSYDAARKALRGTPNPKRS